MGKTATDVMTKAISFLGTKEIPANSNNVVFNTDYYGKAVSGSAYPWCCSYIWDIFRLAGASLLFYDGKKTAYCPTVESWGKTNKLTVDKSKGQYGDIVLFDFSGKGISGHIGFIVEKNTDGSYKTIEGNTAVGNDDNGGSVMYRTRYQSSIRCIIRPKYEAGKKTTNTSNNKVSESPSKSADTTITYTVKSGDTLSKIGTSLKVKWEDIANLNGIKSPYTIKVGQVLKIPSTTTSTSSGKNIPTVAKPTLKKGSTGTQVKYLQQNLNYLGFKGKNGKSLTIDGDLGDNSDYAIRNFQKKYNLEVDGIYGDNSYSKMKSLLK